jgi:hypothetical protein
MAKRHVAAFGVLALACGLAAGATLTAQAPRKWVMARTADGHPDFHGVWANNTVTPLQRPKQWEGKERLTDAEIAELQTFAAQIVENDGDAQFGDGLILAVLNRISNPKSYDPGTGNYNQFWLVDRDWHDRRTALITDPRDGRIPAMTPAAQQKRAAEIEQRRAHAFEDPEVFPLGERCVNFGIPRLQAGYNSYLQIVQAPGYVTIMNEMAHDARIIPLDGRPHLDDRIRVWNGDSRGHWDGDTLVIDTNGIRDDMWLDIQGSPITESARVTERLKRLNFGVMQVEIAVNDPKAYTRPWSVTIEMAVQVDTQMLEEICMDNERDTKLYK